MVHTHCPNSQFHNRAGTQNVCKNIIQRHAVRALLLAQEQILLIRTYIPDSGKTIWLTPGGGIEVDEDPRDALQREIAEETGLAAIDNCSGPVWQRQQQFTLHGRLYHQHEDFYLVYCGKFAADNSGNPAAAEKDIFRGFRWWGLDEIGRADGEIFVPRAMHRHLGQLLQHGPSARPVDVGI